MITKEQLAKMSAEEVSKLFHRKQIECRTCAEFVEMCYIDQEYILLKEQVTENLRKLYSR